MYCPKFWENDIPRNINKIKCGDLDISFLITHKQKGLQLLLYLLYNYLTESVCCHVEIKIVYQLGALRRHYLYVAIVIDKCTLSSAGSCARHSHVEQWMILIVVSNVT